MQTAKTIIQPLTDSAFGSAIPTVSQAELRLLRDCQNALSRFGGELFLFGSRARRDHRDDSDFDFWLRLPKSLHAAAHTALPGSDFSVGLLLLEPDESFPLYEATRKDQIRVSDILELADTLGTGAPETTRKPPKPFTVDVSTPDALLGELLDNFNLELLDGVYQIVEVSPGHPFGAHKAIAPDSSVSALLQAGLLERATGSHAFVLAPFSAIAWELAGAEGSTVIDQQILSSARLEYLSVVKESLKMRF
jgi:predicted nucleotidyltransferase